MVDVVTKLDGQSPVEIVGDRFCHAEFVEALRDAGLDRVPFIWRGFGWKDSSEDCERLRHAVSEGEVKTMPPLLLLVQQTAEEFLAGMGEVENTTVIFRTRYMAGLTTTDRLIYDGTPYDLKQIVERGRRRGLELRGKAQ